MLSGLSEASFGTFYVTIVSSVRSLELNVEYISFMKDLS